MIWLINQTQKHKAKCHKRKSRRHPVAPQRLSSGGGGAVITVRSEERKPPRHSLPEHRRSPDQPPALLMLPISISLAQSPMSSPFHHTHDPRGAEERRGSRMTSASEGTAPRGGHQGVGGRVGALARPWLHIKHQSQHEETKQISKEARPLWSVLAVLPARA